MYQAFYHRRGKPFQLTPDAGMLFPRRGPPRGQDRGVGGDPIQERGKRRDDRIALADRHLEAHLVVHKFARSGVIDDDRDQPQELRPLIAQFNALLDRLAVAYQQMEAFNADVAHELNTPIGNGLTVASALEHRVEEFSQKIDAGLRRSTRLV